MALSHSPSIVTDGLVLCLDAANRKSYPGNGVTWNNLLSTTTSTLINGAGFTGINSGSISFDGTNDYGTLPTNFLKHDSGNPFSLSVWFRTSSTGLILGQQSTNTPDNASGYVPAIYVDTNGKLVTSCFWGGSTSNVSTSTLSVNTGIWFNVVVTVQSTNHISYLNGTSYATLSKTQTFYNSDYYYFLATGRGSNWPNFPASPYFNGFISNFQYYNKNLSPQEVLQNFNALRGRFNI